MPLTQGSETLQQKIQGHTHDVTLASNPVAYTGYGFTPRAIIVIATGPGGNRGHSRGFAEAPSNEKCQFITGVATYADNSTNRLIICRDADGVTGQEASVQSFDSDGFTLSWVKGGAPAAGTINFNVLAIR